MVGWEGKAVVEGKLVAAHKSVVDYMVDSTEMEIQKKNHLNSNLSKIFFYLFK